MFNITAKFCKVWEVTVKDNMTLVDLSVSKKNKDGSYTNSSYKSVKFVGGCLNESKKLAKNDKIDITSGMIGKREYQGKWYDDVVVFSFEHSGSASKQTPDEGFEQITDDSDLPWE